MPKYQLTKKAFFQDGVLKPKDSIVEVPEGFKAPRHWKLVGASAAVGETPPPAKETDPSTMSELNATKTPAAKEHHHAKGGRPSDKSPV
jgi:hypothetical protein